MGQAVGSRRHLPLRSERDALAGVRHRHAAADGQRLAAHRPRLQLHPDRRHRPLPADARQAGLVPDRVGRQRPPDGAPGAELLRHPLRPVAAIRPRVHAACGRRSRQGPGTGGLLPAQLRGAVPTPVGRRRAQVRGLVAAGGIVRGLGADLHDDRPGEPAGVPARLPPPAGPGRGVLDGGTDAVGRRLPDGRRPSRARGQGMARRLPPGGVPPRRRRRRHPHRHHPPRAAARLRRTRRPPRRRALPAAVGHHRPDPAVRRGGPRRRPPAGPTRQGHRDRHDLHLRRRHRRRVVARAAPARPGRHRPRRPAAGRAPDRDAGPRGRGVPLLPGGAHRPPGTAGDRRAAVRLGRAARRAPAGAAPGQVLREGRPTARDRHQQAVVHPHPRSS